jgi:hypothetical protein
MLFARVLAATGLVSSMTLAVAPAMATEPTPTERGATTTVIRRIQPAPPVAAPEREAPARMPAADRAQGSLEPRLDQRARELANLRFQVAALQRALEVLLVSMERAILRLDPAAQRQGPAPVPPAPAKSLTAAPEPAPAKIGAPDAARDGCGTSSGAAGCRSTACSPAATSPSPKNSSPAPSQ